MIKHIPHKTFEEFLKKSLEEIQARREHSRVTGFSVSGTPIISKVLFGKLYNRIIDLESRTEQLENEIVRLREQIYHNRMGNP